MPDFPRGEWKKGQPEPGVTKLTARPVQSGSSCIDVTKSSFLLGATEGNSNNFNPPGILPGEWDEFYLNFGSTVLLEEITWTGVRLQSLPDNINDGSLFVRKEG